jgi:hypothetical protein
MQTEFFLAMKPLTKEEQKMREWKDVVGYEGIYKVSRIGNVYSTYSRRLLKPYIASDGYLRLNLCKNKKVKITMLHRIVAEAFIPNPNNLPVVNHIDGNKANPIADNLEWTTHSKNSAHAFAIGLNHISEKCRKAVSLIAAENGAKTTSKVVMQMDADGSVIKEFSSFREAARETNISRANILRACKSKDYSAGGFKWATK